jgi:hypothetical protein
VGGFAPTVGATFEVVAASGGFGGTKFASSLVPDLASNALWGLAYDADSVTAQVVSTSALGDLNHDNALTVQDWTIYKNGAQSNLSGLSPSQAYDRGDLNLDGVNDLEDFARFRSAYEAANGAGAFAAMLARVPEPSSALLACCGAAIARQCGKRLRRR